MVIPKPNGCRVCPKVFCCVNCRDTHERNKHPNLKGECPLCVSDSLPFDPVCDGSRVELIGHLLLNHLPLGCQLCGQVFTNNLDLISARPCRSKEQLLVVAGPAKRKLTNNGQASTSSRLEIIVEDEDKPIGQENCLDSPLVEKVRLPSTSTPVQHGPDGSQQHQRSAPDFVLNKTPLSFESEVGSRSSVRDEYRHSTSSLRKSESDSFSQPSPSCSILKKHRIDPVTGEILIKSGKNNNNTMEKHVQFADCREASAEDVFFEARESLDEVRKVDARTSWCSPSSTTASCRCNGRNDETRENGNPRSAVTTSAPSSRVIMMLVMEQTDPKALSSENLQSLIDSGLKQLEMNSDKGDGYSECVTSSSSASRAIKYSPEVPSPDKKRAKACHPAKDCSKAAQAPEAGSPKIKDRVIDCYGDTHDKSPVKSDGIWSVVARAVKSAINKLPVQAINHMIPSMPTSLASLMPVMSIEREQTILEISSTSSSSPIIARGCPPHTSAQLNQAHNVAVGHQPVFCSTMRESESDSSPDFAGMISRDGRKSSGSSGSSSSPSGAKPSPTLKRYRGRYRIKARQPIARLRHQRPSPTSPRGASLETQRFQRGSLMVGKQSLPLPSRAHEKKV
ncbi:uncharacterized protein LOC106641595 isoform X2 [Copidosoma floridanum]|uniref:uncharacterized protein LOC106641595 isoform X2 n=1 Tax=Copidosoma floridanum TaxID=29053 RepID=UPI0006C9C75D|nr:uncharacterized protein LOC106641595 isoform X2 [Copidosoma floridanum]